MKNIKLESSHSCSRVLITCLSVAIGTLAITGLSSAQDGGLGRRKDQNGGGSHTQSGGQTRSQSGGGNSSGGNNGGLGRRDNGGGNSGGGNSGRSNSGGGQSHTDSQQTQNGRSNGGGNSGGGNNGGGLGRRDNGGGNRGGGNSNGGSTGGGSNSQPSYGPTRSQSGGNNNGGLGRRGSENGNGNTNSGYFPGSTTRSSQGNSNSGNYGDGNLGRRGGNYGPQNRSAYAPHSGLSTYSSNNNIGFSGGHQGELGRVGQLNAPYVDPRVGSLNYLINRQDQSFVRSNYRSGYCYYNSYPNWNDSYFFYGAYVFNPYSAPCVASPWYFYSCLPGYINYSRVIYVETPWMERFEGDDYRFNYYSWNSNDNFSNFGGSNDGYNNSSPLDRALNDLVRTFQNSDGNALDRIVPQNGSVPIFIDDQYNYSLQASDLYGLLRDNSQSVQTNQYRILDVKKSGNRARVLAEQDYTDPYGNQQSVYHEFMFSLKGREATIIQFGTSKDRPW